MAKVGNVKNYMEYYFELNVVVLVHYYDFLLITSILTNIMVSTLWITVLAQSVYLVFPNCHSAVTLVPPVLDLVQLTEPFKENSFSLNLCLPP